MASDSFECLDWFRALNLTERAASLRTARGGPHVPLPSATDQGRQRLQRWRALSPFSSEDIFARRLAEDGLDESALVRLLSEPLEDLASRMVEEPAWMAEITELLGAPLFDDGQSLPISREPADSLALEWLTFIKPSLHRGRALLQSGLCELAAGRSIAPVNIEGVLSLFLVGLARRLNEMVQRTLVLELNVARLRGELEGECPEDRFRSFTTRIGRREIQLKLLREYPVLARQLSKTVDRWLTFSLDFVRRLCDDWPALREMFSPTMDPGTLVKLEVEAGDRHGGGCSVVIAGFISGLQIVYKPRSLAVDLHFQSLVDWLNSRGQQPLLRTLRVWDRRDYGWCEFVSRSPCDSVEAVKRFYERQGSYLALLYLLNATDFHYENIIAVGEHPALVDLECLFIPQLATTNGVLAPDAASSVLHASVLRVRMLPTRSWTTDSSLGIDVSGLGAPELQISPRPIQFWEASGTDLMRMSRKDKLLAAAANRPALHAGDVDVTEFQQEITSGFATTYRLLASHRHELGAPDGPLAAFSEDEVRVILRPTHLYDVLQRESYHPDMLRDALDRDRFFDQLWRTVEQTPQLASVIAAERQDLWRDDVPRFTARPSSRKLETASGNVDEFFARSGMSLVLERLAALKDADLERQRWLISASFTAISATRNDTRMPCYPWVAPTESATHERFLDAAISIGNRLADLAFWDGTGASWIGLRPVRDRERYYSLSSLGPDLYSGLPGVALFLGYLGASTGEDRYGQLAGAALRTMFHQVERSLSTLSLGAFAGCGGLIYALTHLERLCDERDLPQWSDRLVRQLPERVGSDRHFDIISGSAGCIAGLLTHWQARPSDATLEVAVRCGDHLIQNGRRMEAGIGWVTPLGDMPLAGFSHGAAGIAWALSALGAATGLTRFYAAAIDALEYERSLYSSDTQNWLDLRDEPTPGISAWCHGAVGVGIGRIGMLPSIDTPSARAEIDIALRRTIATGFGRNHSLCHGDLGDLDFLLLGRAAGLLAKEDEAIVWHLATGVLDSIAHHGRLCGVPTGVETPGLMTGLAGIGYGLLRLARPTSVPSVLALEPPRGVEVLGSPPNRPWQPPHSAPG